MTSPITIVVPVYNREYLLQRTLDSIACQSVAPAKIVLVDNASSDSSLEMMHRWAEKITSCEVKVCVETKKGAAAARNRGLREVDSDFVMFFDSDDVMLPGHVAVSPLSVLSFAHRLCVRSAPGMRVLRDGMIMNWE